jgi:hypothetical protein
MPIPSPNKGQSKKKFMESCMSSDTTNKEFPDQKQRAAVCNSKWEEKKSKAFCVAKMGEDEEIVFD